MMNQVSISCYGAKPVFPLAALIAHTRKFSRCTFSHIEKADDYIIKKTEKEMLERAEAGSNTDKL